MRKQGRKKDKERREQRSKRRRGVKERKKGIFGVWIQRRKRGTREV